jgi:hypothetical protein
VDTNIDLQGGELNLIGTRHAAIVGRIEVLAGFRYLDLGEAVRIGDFTASPALGASARSYDAFETRNRFYGGQVGVRLNYTDPRWVADVSAKVAYGGVTQSLRIDGATRGEIAGIGVTLPGGGLTSVTNIGEYNRTHSAFLPELTFNVGYRLSDNALVFVGYNFLYITDVFRAGSQIDPVVNPAFLPFVAGGSDQPRRPSAPLRSEDFWAQGLNFGLALRY